MNIPYIRAPHSEGAPSAAVPSAAPNAALLIDFDNVTMGMRSDLSKELKSLLGSDIIKGKVTVQRAYADWRRYPQYIVPLSEASIDLIFAPAYGSSKKNATDIRMAIDGMELVFIRPEIGTYILLTGDSDFSSLVLKLKEYGKYVIGVGIQESSSDILVQNCDEYYSYTALTGLRKSGSGGDRTGLDPWVLVEKAVEQMRRRKDVMRSDRLKQVMLELDSSFDEKSLGFSKFSRFLTEAAQKGLLQLKKLDNGQYELTPTSGSVAPGNGSAATPAPGRAQARDDRSSRSESRKSERPARPDRSRSRRTPTQDEAPAQQDGPRPQAADAAGLASSYELLVEAISDLLEDQEGSSVRDSDVKRRMLAIRGSWDEAELGFPKFSKFLKQADDDRVVSLNKGDSGNYDVSIGARSPGAAAGAAGPAASESRAPSDDDAERRDSRATRSAETPAKGEPRKPAGAPSGPDTDSTGRLRPRTSSRRRGGADEPPPLFEGQTVGAVSSSTAKTSKDSGDRKKGEPTDPTAPASSGTVDVQALRLPTDRDSAIKYLANSYKGVGNKTAETLVDALGDDLFPTLQSDPDRVRTILTPNRADKVLEQWEADFERRSSRAGDEGGAGSQGQQEESRDREAGPSGGRRRSGRRTRTRSN